MLIILLVFYFYQIQFSYSLNPYRNCGSNTIYSSQAIIQYAASFTNFTITQSVLRLIHREIQHFGFKISNPGLGNCYNFIKSNSSCCNNTTISKLQLFTDIYSKTYGRSKLPIMSRMIDLYTLLSTNMSFCLLDKNNSLNNLQIPGIGNYTYTQISDKDLGNAIKMHDNLIIQIYNIEFDLINAYSCLLCLGTADFDNFLLNNNSILINRDFYNSIVQQYSAILINFTSIHNKIQNYMANFLIQNVKSNQTCGDLYNNYTKLGPLNPCNSTQICKTFAKKYFGTYLFPGILWKFYILYQGWKDPLMTSQPFVFDTNKGFKGNTTYF